MVQKVQEDLSDELTSKKVSIAVSALPVVQGYNGQLQKLFSELISNAMKFSKQDVEPVINITSTTVLGKENELLNSSKNYLVVTVSDNGIGFEKEYVNKIFILFQKLHNQEDSYEGKGLGLSLCQRIMANHEGFITASGEPGLGATFNLYFPV